MKKIPLDINTLKVGDKFRDEKGCLCIYLGYAMEHEHQTNHGSTLIQENGKRFIFQMVRHKYASARVYTYFYKNTWYLEKINFENQNKFYQDVPTEESSAAISKMASEYVGKYECDVTWDDQ